MTSVCIHCVHYSIQTQTSAQTVSVGELLFLPFLITLLSICLNCSHPSRLIRNYVLDEAFTDFSSPQFSLPSLNSKSTHSLFHLFTLYPSS